MSIWFWIVTGVLVWLAVAIPASVAFGRFIRRGRQ